MQINQTQSDGLKQAFTVTLPFAELDQKRQARLVELGRTMRLPGFRPGKVPMSLLQKRYGSAVMAEVTDESVNEATRQLLSERGIRPAMQPKVDLVSAGEDKDLEFTLELEVLPEISVPNLGEITLTRLKAEPTDDAVTQGLDNLLKSRRKEIDVTEDRAAVAGDAVVVDFLGRIDGVAFEGGSASDVSVEIGGTGFIPGFAEQLDGIKAGENRTIKVTFPAEYGAAELAGKDAEFDITAKGLKTFETATADDALATELGFEDLEDLKKFIRDRLQRELDSEARQNLKRQLLDALAERISFDVPPTLSASEFKQIWDRLEEERKAGRLDEADKDKDEDTLRTEYQAIADRRVRLGLLLAEIGQKNGITVTNDELNRAIFQHSMMYGARQKEALDMFRKNPQAAEFLRGPIFEEKVVDYVLELAKVEDKAVSQEELTAAASEE
ncbi:trigger factor [Acidisoma cellulosilytica]|uniref:Trigger factor n=1 Tax=Acidisoma cellulosilyticum TaxID=2802395 RepID=A0A963Z2V8_9PROT|nr:trigger factor [Acidisoma cellulosilyticum]MCB8881857.1 trigger factor [Acidisoma cellulosilyticum]